MYDEMPEFHSAMGEEHGDISHVNACLLWKERIANVVNILNSEMCVGAYFVDTR